MLGIAFGAAALLMVWIAVRSYAAGDTFGTWLFIALAVVMIAVTPRLSDALLALRRRPPPP
ncbi:MAG TPA: hypothetical protein VHT53_09190 [Candidatus Elarobacter sp.]|nr:hypothetical protein [Candidatus Elarobacter sp.]